MKEDLLKRLEKGISTESRGGSGCIWYPSEPEPKPDPFTKEWISDELRRYYRKVCRKVFSRTFSIMRKVNKDAYEDETSDW